MKDERIPRKEPNLPTDSADATGDVAGLYTWANLEGAGYRDFSAARDQARISRKPRKPAPPAAPAADLPSTAASMTASMASKSATPPAGLGPRRLTAVRRPQPVPADTRGGSRRRTTRWAALDRIFTPTDATDDSIAPETPLDVPTLALISLAGGVGKTVLSASLSRAMAAQGRRVLLVDTRPCGLLPLLLATPDLAPGTLQTVSCGTAAAPLAVLTGDNTPGAGDDSLALQLHRAAKGMQQVLMDVATASATLLRQLLPLATHVLVILTPDLASLSSLQALRTLVDPLLDRGDTRVDLHYLINQFEPAERLHVAIREMLQAELGERLLPFALHRSTELQEAMAEGLPVAQVTPEAAIVEDLHHLAQWVSALDDSQTGELLTRRWRQR